MTDQPDLFRPDKPPRDLFAPDDLGRCAPRRAGSHRASPVRLHARGPRRP